MISKATGTLVLQKASVIGVSAADTWNASKKMPNTQTWYFIALVGLASISLFSVANSIRFWVTKRNGKYHAELMGIEVEMIVHKDRHDGNELHLLARNETVDDLIPSILTRTSKLRTEPTRNYTSLRYRVCQMHTPATGNAWIHLCRPGMRHAVSPRM